MDVLILVLHLLIAVALVGVVLMQRSEGGALGIGGGGGGGGAGGGMFSPRGAGNLLTRTTTILGIAFFATSITLTILAQTHRDAGTGSILDAAPVTAPGTPAPAAPAPDDSSDAPAPAAEPAPAQPSVPLSQ